MSLLTKIIIALAIILFFAGGGFAWHLKIVYQSWVASTSKGEPLFERELLEDYGDQIISELVKQNVKLAIVSRSGQPRKQLPGGVMYTHSAFWLYAPKVTETGEEIPHYAVYNLYHGEENRLKSSLVVDAPADFLKLTREHDVGLIIPNGETQNLLATYLTSSKYGEVHQENYSLISNPFDARWQNCNEFMLDSMAAAFWEVVHPKAIKARLEKSLKPTTIEASLVRRTFGPMIDERLIMDDQSKTIFTTTRQTLADFLESEGRLERAYILKLSGTG